MVRVVVVVVDVLLLLFAFDFEGLGNVEMAAVGDHNLTQSYLSNSAL